LGEKLLKLRGRMHFICIAETADLLGDRQGLLQGKIFIIASKRRWKRFVAPRLRTDFDHFDDYIFDVHAPPIEVTYRDRVNALFDFCSDHSAFNAAFCLRRNGVIDITVQDELRVANDAPEFPSNNTELKHQRLLLAAQLYFFLRDIGHRHQHHNPRTDTIVDLHELENDDDFTWRLATLYSIYRRIITYKRGTVIDEQVSSLGLLAYAKAFKRVCEEAHFKRLPAFYDDALKESIQATEARSRFQRQSVSDFFTAVRTVTFAVLGFVLSLVGLAKLGTTTITPNPSVISLAKYVAENPLVFLLISIALGVVWVSLERRLLKVERWRVMRAFQTIGQPFSRWIVGSGMFLLGLALASPGLIYIGRIIFVLLTGRTD
jgi:hypothetical protein